MGFLRTCRKTKSKWFWCCWRWRRYNMHKKYLYLKYCPTMPAYSPMFKHHIMPAWFANGCSVFCKWHYFDETMFPIVLHQEWPSNSVNYLMTCSMTQEVRIQKQQLWDIKAVTTFKPKVFEIYQLLHTITYAYLMWNNSYKR